MDNMVDFVHQVCIKRNKEIDSAVLMEIKQIAIENGIKTEYLLNEKAIISALKKQIPKKPINRKGTTYFHCPVCESNMLNDYCADCGQKLDWSDTE